ncbi:hypothetical protein CJF32_00009749 [Rutstroemia sp. NJR-2017a WRK4]|nr:hypothetical protein CJF32_00009749 [Rutstroemia sp. NJR-2017a WRK4]
MATATTALPFSSLIPAPHHRKNRRRERPGSRARRSLSRKESLQSEVSEGLLEARDATLRFPSDTQHHFPALMNRSRPSPVLRQNWEQSAARWRAREMEEKIAEMVREQRRMFGGEEDSGSGEDIDGVGEDVDLCPAMLEVVLRLWGDVDYADP